MMRTIFWLCVGLLVERWTEKHEQTSTYAVTATLGEAGVYSDDIEPTAIFWGTGLHDGPTYSHTWQPVEDAEHLWSGEIIFQDSELPIGVFRDPIKMGDKTITHCGLADAAAHCDEDC
jgi:hypothetical protein